MSDNIKLVVEIPESDYKAICANKEDAIIAHDTCRRIAKNGIPLDTVENKGDWIFDGFCGNFGYDDRCECHCSNCNKKIIVNGCYYVGKGYSILEGTTPNFCSNCGADMRGE